MSRAAFCILLLLAILSFQDSLCNYDGYQLRQMLKKFYAFPYLQQPVSRRNIGDLTGPGTSIVQEPSSRDLDVGFAVGVKDDGNDSDLLLNNHSTKTSYSPTTSAGQPNSAPSYVVQEPSSATKELNIGLYVDPRNGVQYYTPGLVPSTSNNPRPAMYQTPPQRYVGAPMLQSIGQNYPGISPNQQLIPLNPYQKPLVASPFASYPAPTPVSNYVELSPSRNSIYNEPPYPYQLNLQQTPYTEFRPIPDYTETTSNRLPSLDNFRQALNPHQRYPQNPFDTGNFVRGKPYSTNNFYETPNQFAVAQNQFSTPPIWQPISSNIFDNNQYPENFPLLNAEGRFPRIPYQLSDSKYLPTIKNLQNVFKIEEQVPKELYRQFVHPVVVRQEQRLPEVILNEQGTPVMSAEPYGDRQVGTFKLRNDHGYQVMMNVPPVPTDGPTDGVLVMEMKATLYRPLN